MFILLFLPVYLSTFFVVFKILVSSVSNMDDDSRVVSFDIYNPGNGVLWEALNILILEGKKDRELPTEIRPGKINVKLMTY